MNRFKHRHLRDLAWVICSPPLVSGQHNNTHWWSQQDCLAEFNDCLPALLHLDQNPEALELHLSTQKSKRLGHYFEALIAYWLMLSPNYELLAQNIQIIQNKRTLGEIDFIIKELQSSQIIHLEVAVKFYLGSPPYNDPYRWFGMNTQDQLGKKVDHLINHQTQLSKNYASDLLKLTDKIDKRHCLLKGRLFYPSPQQEPPHGVEKSHLRGKWTRKNHTDTKNLLYPINKSLWLAKINNEDIDRQLIQTNFTENEQPECYAALEMDKSGAYIECGRVFYLPKDFIFPKN